MTTVFEPWSSDAIGVLVYLYRVVADSFQRLAKITGANREYILNHIPHISRLMVDSMQEVLDHAGTVVIGNGSEEFREAPTLLAPGQSIVDLVRISDTTSIEGVYDGICW